jgi:hypothetical protein
VFRSRLTSLDGLERVTPEVGYTLGASGLTINGLNQPFVALSDAADHGDDVLARMTVRHEVSDNYHLSSVGLVFGVTADGKGNVLVIPKANVWSGHSQPKPRLRKLALNAVDANNPSAINTGWNLESRMWPLVEAAGEAQALTADAGASYPTDSSYTVPVATDTDIAVRVAGRFCFVYTKQRVMSPTQIAQYATWTLRTVAALDAVRKRYGAVTRMGLAVGTDVYAAKTAFEGAFYGDSELQLTDATKASLGTEGGVHAPRAGAYQTPVTGTITELEGRAAARRSRPSCASGRKFASARATTITSARSRRLTATRCCTALSSGGQRGARSTGACTSARRSFTIGRRARTNNAPSAATRCWWTLTRSSDIWRWAATPLLCQPTTPRSR